MAQRILLAVVLVASLASLAIAAKPSDWHLCGEIWPKNRVISWIFNPVEGLPCVARDVFLMFDVVVLFDMVCRRFCEKLWLKDRIPTFESFPSVVRVSFSTFLKCGASLWMFGRCVWELRVRIWVQWKWWCVHLLVCLCCIWTFAFLISVDSSHFRRSMWMSWVAWNSKSCWKCCLKHLFPTMLDWRNVHLFLNFFINLRAWEHPWTTSLYSYPYLKPVVVFLSILSFICVLVFEEFGFSVS